MRAGRVADLVLLVALGASIGVLAGCSVPQQGTPGEAAPGPSPEPGTAAAACGELSVHLSEAFNAAAGYELGEVSDDEYVQRMTSAREGYLAVEAESGSELANAVEALRVHLEGATPTADGAPFDHTNVEYNEILGRISAACEAAGSELEVTAEYGG